MKNARGIPQNTQISPFPQISEWAATLESFVTRFPESVNTPIALYYLHLLYTNEKNFTKAEEYKTKIIEKYPESNYTKALTNPDFHKDIKQKNKELEKTYADSYRLFVKGDYKGVILLHNQQEKFFKDTYLQAKFDFLKAVSEGKLYGIPTLQTNMQNIINTYPKDAVSTLAKTILDYISKEQNQKTITQPVIDIVSNNSVKEEQKKVPDVYVYPSTPTTHIYVIAAKSEFIDMKKLKFNIVNYNLDYFTNFNFSIEQKDLDATYSIIAVSPFQNANQAMNYFDLINYNQEIYENIEKVFTRHCIISVDNYKTLLQDRNIETYLKFFDEYYIR